MRFRRANLDEQRADHERMNEKHGELAGNHVDGLEAGLRTMNRFGFREYPNRFSTRILLSLHLSLSSRQGPELRGGEMAEGNGVNPLLTRLTTPQKS